MFDLDSSIIVALITGACGVVGQFIISSKHSKDDEILNAQREQRQNDRMEIIEKKLDEHNGYAKKFSEVEKSLVSIKKDIEFLKKGFNEK